MKAVLDTHTFLWWITDQSGLSERVKEILKDKEAQLFISAVTGWEIAIKTQLKRISLPETPPLFIPKQIRKNNFEHLPVTILHTLAVYGLPMIHQDPFDRLLIAQARCEKIPIITKDQLIQQYDVKVIW